MKMLLITIHRLLAMSVPKYLPVFRLRMIFANGVRQSIRFDAEMWQIMGHPVRECVPCVRNVVRFVTIRIKNGVLIQNYLFAVQLAHSKNALFLIVRKPAVEHNGN
ncbi:hypothetical protein [uncultured Gimesia sp.]|uniref:hypothetical protein n=1 Tax=uncultured Gimesia sp. TaxID=1678688 RepID=UPI0030DD22AF